MFSQGKNFSIQSNKNNFIHLLFYFFTFSNQTELELDYIAKVKLIIFRINRVVTLKPFAVSYASITMFHAIFVDCYNCS